MDSRTTLRPRNPCNASGSRPRDASGRRARRLRPAQPGCRRGWPTCGGSGCHINEPRSTRPVTWSSSARARPAWPPRSTAPRKGLVTVALDAVATGGQAATSSRIENYLGFPAGLSGGELADRATIQARSSARGWHDPARPRRRAGAGHDGRYVIRLRRARNRLRDRARSIATGARYRKLEVPRLEEFESTCVYYAATQMEAQWCARRPDRDRRRRQLRRPGDDCSSRGTRRRSHLVVREAELTGEHERATWPTASSGSSNVDDPAPARGARAARRRRAALRPSWRRTGSSGDRRPLLDAHALFVFIGARSAHGLARRPGRPRRRRLRASPAPESRGAKAGACYLETSQPGVLAVGDVPPRLDQARPPRSARARWRSSFGCSHLGRSHGVLQRAAMAAPT